MNSDKTDSAGLTRADLPDGAPQNVALERLRQMSNAEQISSALRTQILDGTLSDGDVLPKQEELAERFGTSSPSVRDGLRILESEGLVTVRRGRHGGAVVHAPTGDSAAYMLGLVFQARQVRLAEIGDVLRDLEPVCAGLCAQRPDRLDTVVPRLQAVQAEPVGEEGPDRIRQGRKFHEELVRACGQESMVVLIGVLVSIWSAHAAQSAEHGLLSTGLEVDYLHTRREDHDRLIELIAQGDVDAAAKCDREHLETSTYYRAEGEEAQQVIRADLLARYIFPGPAA